MRKGGGVGVKRKMEDEEDVTEELMKCKKEGRRVWKRRKEGREGGREGKQEERGVVKLMVMINFRQSTGRNAVTRTSIG